MVNLFSSKVYKKRISPSFSLGSVILQTCKMLAMQGMQDSLYLSSEGCVLLFSSGINKWPLTWKTKILLVLWICFSLFVALGTIRTIRASRHPKSLLSENLDLGDSQKSYAWAWRSSLQTCTNLLIRIASVSAYNGGLVASLTYPVRSKEVNTFADLLNLPSEATVTISRWSSHYEMLKNATDPVLQVSNNILQGRTKHILFYYLSHRQ